MLLLLIKIKKSKSKIKLCLKPSSECCDAPSSSLVDPIAPMRGGKCIAGFDPLAPSVTLPTTPTVTCDNRNGELMPSRAQDSTAFASIGPQMHPTVLPQLDVVIGPAFGLRVCTEPLSPASPDLDACPVALPAAVVSGRRDGAPAAPFDGECKRGRPWLIDSASQCILLSNMIGRCIIVVASGELAQ